MKLTVTKEFACADQFLFVELLKTIQQDVKRGTGKNLPLSQITEGLMYDKYERMGSKNRTHYKAKVASLKKPSYLRLEFVMPRGRHIVEYTLKKTSSGCHVDYSEALELNRLDAKLNQAFSGLLNGGATKKKMLEQLDQLEQTVLKNY